jgi:two-component system, NtrC family, nitrogen regulation sensor histidine kinase NtrY
VSDSQLKVLSSFLLILSIAFFVSIPFVPNVITSQLARPPQLNKAKDVIKERTNNGINITKQLINVSIDEDISQAFELLSQSISSELDKDGLAVFIFKEEELVFWSQNMDIYDVPEFSDRLVLVQNTWCISYWIARDNYKGLLLVTLKNGYPYQNQFITNDFHASLSFLDGYMISANSLNGSFPLPIFSLQPVFYLTYIPKDFAGQVENSIAILSRVGFLLLLAAIYSIFWIERLRRLGMFAVLILVITLSSLRVLTLHWQFFPQGNWALFGPEVFAYSWLSPSLGDLLINIVLIFALVC